MLDLNMKNKVNPLKTWPLPISQSLAILPQKGEVLENSTNGGALRLKYYCSGPPLY